MAQLDAEVLRRPIGQSIVAICRDFGISPSLCEGSFWNRVFMAIHSYRGNVSNVVLEMQRREKRFDKDYWKHPNLPLPEQTREGIRRVLGFRIGETPVDPFRPAPGRARLRRSLRAAQPPPDRGTGPGRARLRRSAECAGRGGCDRTALNAARIVRA